MGMLRRVVGEDVEVVFSGAEDLLDIKADASQMEQVLMALAVNAREEMPAGGRLAIETRNATVDGQDGPDGDMAAGKCVVLTVADTGCGMDEETTGRVFEPFFGAKNGGSGLGLSTTYGIVKQHGGQIKVDSAPGNGTTFSVWLPSVTREGGRAPRLAGSGDCGSGDGVEMVALAAGDTTVQSAAWHAGKKNGEDR
jgi:signal transduction histidine kinase